MPSRPNILLIQTDQQRFDTIHALGNPIIQTPAQDRLVAEGTAFTSAYCPSPVCVSSRCSMLLGQWPHRTGCTSNTPMPQDRTSLMEYLNGAGYQTHGIGKMHFSPENRKMWGFETRVFSEEGSGGDDFSEHLENEGYGHIVAPQGERSEYYYIPQPSQLPERLHHTQWLGDGTIDFLEKRDRQRPFFCWTSFIKPHPPFENPVPWNRLYRTVEMPLPFLPTDYEELLTYWSHFQNRYKYRDQGMDMNLVRTMRAAYYACISFIDYNVGRILAALEAEGVLDDTLILYTSDHGEMLGDYNCYGKRSFLDPSARVPLLARYPERFRAGHECETPVSLVDVLPTCLGAAGLSPTDDHDGADLAELAGGNTNRQAIIGQFSEGARGVYMLVMREHKYVYSAADRREWLFQRLAGRMEERNLAGNPAFNRVLAAHRERMISWLRDDGYDEAVDGDGWREFDAPEPIPSDPDAWQLFQDGRSVADRFPDGYGPSVDTLQPPPIRGF